MYRRPDPRSTIMPMVYIVSRQRLAAPHFEWPYQSLRWLVWSLLAWLTLSSAPLHAHGSVVAGGDNCIIRMDFYSAHFDVFQPRSQGQRAFCEDLPEATETVFVLEYLHDSLREVPVEFRLIRNPTGLGRFTRWPDLEHLAALDDITVFHRQLEPQRDGFVTLMHTFDQPGPYVGIVTAPHPSLDENYIAVFPFQVGQQGSRWWLFGLIAIPGGMWLMRRRSQHRRGSQLISHMWAAVIMSCSLLTEHATAQSSWTTCSEPEGIEIHWQSQLTPVALNTLHTWTLTLRDADGEPLEVDRIDIEGGMPAHNHGLPTRPQIRYQSGLYLVEGLRFHMPGRWQLRLQIEHDGRRYHATLEFDL